MTLPSKEIPCLNGAGKKECIVSVDSEETDSDEELAEESLSNFTGVKLIYFEHSYMKNMSALCNLHESIKCEAGKSSNTQQQLENHDSPVRKSQTKISDAKLSLEKEESDSKHKRIEKEESKTVENGEYKRKQDQNIACVESRRKRTFSEPSKSKSSDSDNEVVKNKKPRVITKPKSPVKTKNSDIIVGDSENVKKRKRIASVPSETVDKMEEIKASEKVAEKANKARRKKCLSLSEDLPISKCVESEKKKIILENKVSGTKVLSSPNPVAKPKFKKTSRRESLRLVINEDEPPLFSQPDKMVKVKSDDSGKKEEKNEMESKIQSQTKPSINVTNDDTQTPDIVEKNNIISSKMPEESEKYAETNTEMSVVNSQNIANDECAAYSCEKEEIKHVYSENSSHKKELYPKKKLKPPTEKNNSKVIKLNTGQRQFPCCFCEKTFKRKHHFKEHIRIHKGEKPFVCNKCGKAFTQSGTLHRHLKNVHQDAKTLQCETCNKEFLRNSDYQKHLLSHTSGTKYFSCDLCVKEFRSKIALKRHVQKFHKV